MFGTIMSKFKLDGKIAFVTTDDVSSAKRQVCLKSEEESIMIDIHEDPGENREGEHFIDDILCQLELDDVQSFVQSDAFMAEESFVAPDI